MKGNQITFTTTIKDPVIKLDCLKREKIEETVLSIMTKYKRNPLFYNFKADWQKDIKEKSYSLVDMTPSKEKQDSMQKH